MDCFTSNCVCSSVVGSSGNIPKGDDIMNPFVLWIGFWVVVSLIVINWFFVHNSYPKETP